jgi:hypothetical protein
MMCGWQTPEVLRKARDIFNMPLMNENIGILVGKSLELMTYLLLLTIS